MHLSAWTLRFALLSTIALAGCAAPADVTDESVESSQDELRAIGPTPSGHAARYPFVLVHGFRGSPTKWGFKNVARALRADGHEVIEATLPPHGSAETRGRALAAQLEPVVARTGKVNILAHSMGGLDSRVLVSELGWGDRVASLTTIATPHRGSAFADAILGLLPGEKFDDAVNALADAYDATYSEIAGGSDVRASYTSLSEAHAPAFNAAHADDPRVFYQSWAGVSNVLGLANAKDGPACEHRWYGGSRRVDTMDGRLLLSAVMVAHRGELRPNDGLVTVESAKWGTFRGCIPADHIDEVGGGLRSGTHIDSGFDHVRFYRNAAFELAGKGF
jgi:triacylglycerol lipase